MLGVPFNKVGVVVVLAKSTLKIFVFVTQDVRRVRH